MKLPKKLPYINDSQQEMIIEAFIKFYNEGYEIALKCLQETCLKITVERMLQFIFLVVFQISFGFSRGSAISILISGQAEKVKNYIAGIDQKFPGKSTASIRMLQVIKESRIIDLIESNHTLKNLIRTQNYKEEDFRDFFKTHFIVDENWNVDDEFKGKLDRQNDLRVISASQPLFRISTEFKIWKRNFDKYEPVQELLDNMGNLDKKGLIFMVNPNKGQIDEKLKDELIYNHQKYISDTYVEIKIEDRLFPIYKASYREKNQSIEIYHIIFNLLAFYREDD